MCIFIYTFHIFHIYIKIYIQNRNRLTDIENKLMVTSGEKKGWEG